jgi:hypothetical protein
MVDTRSKKRKFIELQLENTDNIILTKSKKKKEVKLNELKTDIEQIIPESENELEEDLNQNISESENEFVSEPDTEIESISEDCDENLEQYDKQYDKHSDINNEITVIFNSLNKIYTEFKEFVIYKNKNKNIDQINEQEDSDFDPELDILNQNIDNILNGGFFERELYSEDKLKLKNEEIKEFNNQLNEIKKVYKNSPNILDVIKLKIPNEQKKYLLEAIYNLENYEILSPEYNNKLKYIENVIKESSREPELVKLEQEIHQRALSSKQESYKTKILKSKMSFDNKIIAYQKLEIMESYEQGHSDEFIKYKNWIESLLNIPFGNYNNIPVNINTSTKEEMCNYILSIRNTLDSQLSFLEKPKDQIINIVSQMIRNPECNINSIGLYGNKGLGKTHLCESIAKALNRPLRTISLGGESDSSNLIGHNFTYVGSQSGRFIEILKETQTMNPIFLIDELDKISSSEKGKEIIGTLIHLTDSTTNHSFNLDKYFSGIQFDLSKALFIFTYNDPTKIDKILSDRLFKIKVDNYNYTEKLEIANKHLINTILNKLNLSDSIQFSQEAISYLVKCSQNDEGMRDIKTKIKIILTRINTLLLTNPNDNIIRLKYRKLYSSYQTLPIIIPKEHIDIFLDESINMSNNNVPFGMYI